MGMHSTVRGADLILSASYSTKPELSQARKIYKGPEIGVDFECGYSMADQVIDENYAGSGQLPRQVLPHCQGRHATRVTWCKWRYFLSRRRHRLPSRFPVRHVLCSKRVLCRFQMEHAEPNSQFRS